MAIEAFAAEFGAKWPKALSKITSEKEQLLTYYDTTRLNTGATSGPLIP